MAHTPPHAASPHHYRHAARRRVATASGHASTLVVLAFLWPACSAHAQQRTCDQWSADITAVEGRVEVRRRDNPNWVALTTGDRVCTGDALRSQSSSRATITLPDGGTLRVDENSALALPEPPSGLESLVELLRGVIHVISRDPRFLKFTTPYANAGLEGTEFDIRVDENNRLTEIIVLEGEVAVSTPAGELSVGSDHVAVAKDGEAPAASPYAEPIERMRWASHYPPIIDHALPGPDHEPTAAERTDAAFYATRAAARLATARIEGAEADIADALRIAPGNATALSLNALLALARADREEARELLARALAAEPSSVVARITLSHVEQSTLALAAAERPLHEALTIEPDNSIVVTRLAEIALARGDAQSAVAGATRARSLAPTHSAPLVVLGFANLRAFDTASAESAFAAAVELEPDAPLPRLGLALAAIQRGDLAEGRRQLELSVALDPANPLTRSYMAKVYDAEHRGELTSSQLDLAKEFDPVDPTPWLYSSLHNLRTNRPVEALHDLHAAARKNGDRPIFGSWLPLDEDIATRNAGLGRVHNELGFGRLALADAWQAVGDDPTNFAGHRLLADGYSTQPRHEAARVSELLVSQLLQPASIAPIKPQLAQQNLFIAQRAGPSHTSFDEFASPVIANGLKLRASAVGGTHGIVGDDVTLAGLRDRFSYSVGHYSFATDGFRENNDLDQSTANAFVQYRPSYDTNLQAELRSSRRDHGDLTAFFDPEVYSRLLRGSEEVDSLRLGAKKQVTPNHILLGSLIAQDVLSNGSAEGVFSLRSDEQAYSVDVQDIARLGRTTVQTGVVAAQHDQTVASTVFVPGVGPVATAADETNRQIGLYGYVTFNPVATLAVTAGASLDSIELDSQQDDVVNPKLGVVWRPTASTTIRAAAFKTLYNDLTTSQQNAQPRLEPTQVAGFTQLIFGGRGDEATVRGLAVEHELSPNLFVGGQASSRRTETAGTSLLDGVPETVPVDLREREEQAYLYWMPSEQVSFSARYEHGRYSSEPIELLRYSEMTTRRLPIEVRYFSRGGLTLGARASRVHQEGTFETPAPLPFESAALAPGEDRFWVVDAFVGYRLANRRGLLSLNADNLLDEDFHFQDIDPTNPSLFPERLISLRFTLAFD
jgi:tetratricopeptide (TPR) repeat protein